ncbi:MAG: Glu/Leu/Phe/Val dehydrogenase [Candidatus Eremiobacteraeota bacterium]|nr:Glu/Leu/Phe/Val dehydrogenase [Candidatus Eremiobacteraeota bacterium]
MKTTEFIRDLEQTPQRRLAVVRFDEGLKASLSEFQWLADKLEEYPDQLQHEGLFLEIGRRSGLLMGAFLHWTFRGPGAGGVRLWPYQDLSDYLTDGLRLAVGMGRKNALAGLWWGGGKGVICRPEDAPFQNPQWRKEVYQDYGDFVSSIDGCYVTAEDAGTTPPDMAEVFSRTRFTTCIPAEFGGSGNPSGPTAVGVLRALQALAEHLGYESLRGLTVAIQGAGQVGGRLANHLLEEGVGRLVMSDLDRERIPEGVDYLEPDKILAAEVDLLSPCALGAVLNAETIPQIRAQGICGAANNQLQDPVQDSEALHQRGIIYVPDYVANRMGIVNCADEQSGRLEDDPRVQRHLSLDWPEGVYQTVRRILRRSSDGRRSPESEAVRLADEAARQHHPLWGHRPNQIARAVWKKFRDSRMSG